MAADGVSEKSTTRWLDVVRYAVASVVTVLIVTVIARAIVVVVRPETFSLMVVGDSVSAKPAGHGQITLSFRLLGANPSGRAGISYNGVKGFLLDTSTSPPNKFVLFSLPSGVEADQQQTADVYVNQVVTRGESIDASYYDTLYNGSSIDGAKMQLNGTLVTGISSSSTHGAGAPHPAIYCCEPLTVGGGGGDDSSQNRNVLCARASCIP